MIGMIMTKKVIIKYCLTALKYLITLALGYLGGSAEVL